MNKKKIAILMTIAGGGHLSVAKSLQQMLGDDFEITIINFYKEVIHSKDEQSYNLILKYNLSCLYWPVFIKLFRIKLLLLKNYYIKLCKKYFINNKFDVVISVIPFFNEIIGKSIDKPLIIVPTDLSNPYPAYWYAKSDLIITCTEQLFKQATESGYKNVTKIPSLPLRKEFYLPIPSIQSTVKPANKKILILYGKTPPNRVINIIQELIKVPNICISIVCGENQTLFNRINKSFKNITSYQLIENIQEILDMHDIVITKPGPTSILETISRKKMLLVDNSVNTLLHEKYNIEFVINNKFGYSFDNVHTLNAILKKAIINNVINSSWEFKSPQKELIKQINQIALPE